MKKFLARAFLEYLRLAARIQIWKIQPHIVGITGSAGKTSTMMATYQVLSTRYKCKISYKANSESGIALDILGIQAHDYSLGDWLRIALLTPWKLATNWEEYEIYIVEMGIDGPDEPKNMSYLLKVIQPETGILINATPTHSEPFDHLVKSREPEARAKEVAKLIANEKGKLIASLPRDGFAILNMYDENVAAFEHKTKARVIGVGKQVNFSNIKTSLQGFSAEFTADGQKLTLKIPDEALSNSYAITFGLAIAVGMAYRISFHEAIDALKSFRSEPGRSRLVRGIKDTTIIDSSYNASTLPMIEMLDMLGDCDPARKKIAVLGDMREMGEEAQHEHESVAMRAVENADEIVTVGPLMRRYLQPKAIHLGFAEDKIHCFDNAYEALEFLEQTLKGKEILLVKGSQNTLLLEIIVEGLMRDRRQADKLLARRGEYWDAQRAKIRKSWKKRIEI